MTISNPLADTIRKEARDIADHLAGGLFYEYREPTPPEQILRNDALRAWRREIRRIKPRDKELEQLFREFEDKKTDNKRYDVVRAILVERMGNSFLEEMRARAREAANMRPPPPVSKEDSQAAVFLYLLAQPAFDHTADFMRALEQCRQCDYPEVRQFMDTYRHQLDLARAEMDGASSLHRSFDPISPKR